MPDVDDSDPRAPSAPASWGEAFAALPQQAPDPGGWQRLQMRLPGAAPRRVRKGWPVWLATAASLGLVVALPLRMSSQSRVDASAPSIQAPIAATPAHPVPATMPVVAPAAHIAEPLPGPTPASSRATPRRATRSAPWQRPIRTAAEPADATRIATGASVPADLGPLHARSEQLQSLLAMARDERVASGPSAALIDALDTRIVAIDATLAQAGLSDAQRGDLWNQRVDALQELVGIETTNRLYAARGQGHDAALVSVD